MDTISESIIIIPVHNELNSIGTVIEEIGSTYSYVIVDDHSDDGTFPFCESSGFTIIRSDENQGKQNAIRAGIRYALDNGFRFAVTLDGDGQHLPAYIPEMLRLLSADIADIIIGSRYLSERKPINSRMIGSRIISRMIATKTGIMIADPTSGMHAYSRSVMKDIVCGEHHYAEPDLLTMEILMGRRVKEVQVQMRERIYGKSTYVTAGAASMYMIRVLNNIRKIQID